MTSLHDVNIHAGGDVLPSRTTEMISIKFGIMTLH